MSQLQSLILVECKADRTLVQALGIPRRRIRHLGSKGDICNYLRRSQGAIAVMDEDPHSLQPRYLQGLKEHGIAVREADYGIWVLRDRERNHRIILLSPRLEGWILRVADRNGIDIQRQFGLPNRENTLHEAWIQSKNLSKLKQLIRFLSDTRSKELEFLMRYLGGQSEK